MAEFDTNVDGEFFAQLSVDPIIFDPVSPTVSVFFDDANQHIFVVRSNGAGGIIVYDNAGNTIALHIEDKGEILAIRLTPNRKLLTIQRAPNAIDFLNCPDSKRDSTPFCQTCKGKTTRINDFFWASDSDIIFVTDLGLEFYEVDADRKTVKCTKTISIGLVNWSLWHYATKMLVVSSGVYGNVLYPFHYDNSNLTKYSKVEVELALYPPEPKLTLLRRDVALAQVYSDMYIITLKHDTRSTQSAEVILYKRLKERAFVRSNILKLTSGGQFQLNIIDSLLVVHHLQSKTSLLYDIKFCLVSEQQVAIHQQPLIAPLPLKQLKPKSHFVPNLPSALAATKSFEMYSSSWIIFQPDIVIDAVRGCMWRVELNLHTFPLMIPNKCLLIEVLLHRAAAKDLIFEVLKDMIGPQTPCTLSVIGDSFNKINKIYAYNEEVSSEFELLTTRPISPASDAVVVIQQDDMYTHVFCPIFNDYQDQFTNKNFPIAVMIEYMNSLHSFGLSVHFYLYELLVNTLVKAGDLYRLHQFLQYHVMADSKHLACLLLSIQNVYPAAHQIALDMLKRLGTAHDQIVEVFLSKNQVLTAMHYLRSVGCLDKLQPRKFLSIAKEIGDPDVFFTTYKFFEENNLRNYKSASFAPNDHCEEYEVYFRDTFSQ